MKTKQKFCITLKDYRSSSKKWIKIVERFDYILNNYDKFVERELVSDKLRSIRRNLVNSYCGYCHAAVMRTRFMPCESCVLKNLCGGICGGDHQYFWKLYCGLVKVGDFSKKEVKQFRAWAYKILYTCEMTKQITFVDTYTKKH